MLFNSQEFLFFFIFIFSIFFIVPFTWRWFFLLLGSYFVYASFSPVFVLILVLTTCVTYVFARGIEIQQGKRRTVVFLLGILAPILQLFIFKYFNFFAENVNQLSQVFGYGGVLPLLNLILPVGISFYTFQSVGYLIDVYRGQKAETHLGKYALFLSFFPLALSGPIERAHRLIPQFSTKKNWDWQKIISGFQLVLWGLFKKAVIADRLAELVSPVYASPTGFNGMTLIIATILYSFQLYADFSGYSDMAVGIARMFGIDLIKNFNTPYFAKTLSDLWKKWHISLSSWFNDYLFTPLTIATRDWGINAVYFSILCTFLVSGLWHGSAWSFVAWGAIQGGWIVFELVTQKQRKKLSKKIHPVIFHVCSSVIVFLVWSFSMIFWANKLPNACYIVTHLFNSHGAGLLDVLKLWKILVGVAGILFLLTVDLIHYHFPLGEQLRKMPVVLRLGIYYGLIAAILVLGSFSANQFIYFKF